jgi:hypothetical protein
MSSVRERKPEREAVLRADCALDRPVRPTAAAGCDGFGPRP